MTPYRAHDSIGSVCIVCYRHAARSAATCPRCGVEMTSTTAGTSAAEVQRGLETRARDFAARPKRMRAALTYGGATVLALVAFVILVATGVYDPKIEFGLIRGGGAWLWPAFVLYILFSIALIPIATRVYPSVPPPPPSSNIPELVHYLRLVVVDEVPDSKPPKDRHG